MKRTSSARCIYILKRFNIKRLSDIKSALKTKYLRLVVSLVRAAVAAIAASSLVAAIAGPARAQASLSVGPSRITAEQPLFAGCSYNLPPYSITNGSSKDLKISVSVSDHRDSERDLPPAEWFRIEPQSFLVPAGETRKVQVRVVLPTDAAPGSYRVWFKFQAVPADTSGIAVAAAVQVSFIFDLEHSGADSGAVSAVSTRNGTETTEGDAKAGESAGGIAEIGDSAKSDVETGAGTGGSSGTGCITEEMLQRGEGTEDGVGSGESEGGNAETKTEKSTVRSGTDSAAHATEVFRSKRPLEAAGSLLRIGSGFGKGYQLLFIVLAAAVFLKLAKFLYSRYF